MLCLSQWRQFGSLILAQFISYNVITGQLEIISILPLLAQSFRQIYILHPYLLVSALMWISVEG